MVMLFCKPRPRVTASGIALSRSLLQLYLVLMVHLSMVSHKLQPSEHCANCEKAQSLCPYYTKSDHLLPVDVTHTVEHCFGCCRDGGHAGHDGSRIAEGVDEGLEVR